VFRELLGMGRRPGAAAAVEETLAPPSGALTRWLRQGIELGMCPLCRVAHKADREYMWHFSEEGSGDGRTLAALAQAHGFCADHVRMLERIDLEARSMLGISTVFADTLAEIVAELETLGVGEPCADRRCPACVNRDDALRSNARYLLASLGATAGAILAGYRGSAGLCFPHFELVWASGGPPAARQLILEVQRRAVAEIHAELLEFIRKEGAEARHEPRGTEQDAWERALRLTAGWPAPRQSAGVPEARGWRPS